MNTPWEVSKRLRGESSFTLGALPPIPGNGKRRDDDSAVPSGFIGDSFRSAGIAFKSSNDTRLWQERLSWERKAAYKKWTSLISKQFNAWEVCRQLWAGDKMKMAQGSLLESVMDSLGTKATSTIHARAGPLLQMVHHCEQMGWVCFPLTEHTVYNYMKSCEDRAPSYLRSLLLAISFANFHFGLDRADAVLSSGRIRGCSSKHYAEKRKLVQRPPLSQEQVVALEKIVLDESRTDVDRIGAGFFLVLVYGRLRFSDAQHVSNLILDMPNPRQGFLEGTAGRTKISVSLERKCGFLPIAIPTIRQHMGEDAIECWSWEPVAESPFERGYHSEGRDRSMLTYSRDGMAGPLRLLCKMLAEVKQGRFIPDSTRSGRFPEEYRNPDAAEEDRKSEASSSSSDGSDHESDVDHGAEENAMKEVVGKWDPGIIDLGDAPVQFARHNVSRCIHVMQDESGMLFKCGRKMIHTYIVLPEKPSFMHPLCNTCFRPDSA
eukprot:s946_g18.t1